VISRHDSSRRRETKNTKYSNQFHIAVLATRIPFLTAFRHDADRLYLAILLPALMLRRVLIHNEEVARKSLSSHPEIL
jgi:hypothetical protein